MKKLLAYATVTFFVLAISVETNAQGMFDKLKQKVKEKVDQRIDSKENKAIDKTLDNIDGTNSSKSANNSTKNSDGVTLASNKEKVPTAKTYANYDFVPGDKIIFESQIADEQVGEIPSQFTVSEGQLDVQMEDGEKVLHTLKGATITFTPRMTTQTYMPDQFTVEFDFKNEKYGVSHLNVDFGHRVYYSGGEGILPGMTFSGDFIYWINGDVKYPEALHVDYDHPMEWHHIAIAINKNVGKAYIDQYRVINLNSLTGKPNNVTFNINGYEDSYIKNVRIASGGIDIYKKVTTEGKIITHGILFDVDKSTFRPESMGTINTIYNILKEDPSLKFEIDGHTDNTGTSAHNATLSQQRADAVKEKLVSMGIDASRLTSKGFGDSKPIDKNDTPEGKANNRRVEFIKI